MPLEMLLAAYIAIISPGHDDVDFLRFVFADWHRETAANDVAKDVIGHIVDVLVSAVLFQEVDRVMTPRPAQPTPGSGPPDQRKRMSRETNLHNLFDLEILDAASGGGQG